MVDAKKETVSCKRFVELLNEELRRDAGYQPGMCFIHVCTGYDFIASMLTVTEKNAMDKVIFDRVSVKYTVLKT
jgi:hypothetical protein